MGPQANSCVHCKLGSVNAKVALSGQAAGVADTPTWARIRHTRNMPIRHPSGAHQIASQAAWLPTTFITSSCALKPRLDQRSGIAEQVRQGGGQPLALSPVSCTGG